MGSCRTPAPEAEGETRGHGEPGLSVHCLRGGHSESWLGSFLNTPRSNRTPGHLSKASKKSRSPKTCTQTSAASVFVGVPDWKRRMSFLVSRGSTVSPRGVVRREGSEQTGRARGPCHVSPHIERGQSRGPVAMVAG